MQKYEICLILVLSLWLEMSVMVVIADIHLLLSSPSSTV